MSKLLKQHINNLRNLQTESGLFLASSQDVSTGYDKAWLRDNFYISLAFEEIEDWVKVYDIWEAILNILIKHKDKINWAIKNKPHESWQYIHARYHPETFEEFWEEWGNKQNDAVGAVLYKLADLEKKGQGVINSDQDKKIIQRLVDYLTSLKYWEDPDSGVWEEVEEIHSSSIGACIAALEKADQLDFITVPSQVIGNGRKALNNLLPRESETKFCDLAQLSLIWPFDVIDQGRAEKILERIEYYYNRRHGTIRYKNDAYYNKNKDSFSQEAEWCMGFAWLAIIYHKLGNLKKAKSYLEKAKVTITSKGKIPEIYFSNSEKPNENTPLGWAESLFIIACNKLSNS